MGSSWVSTDGQSWEESAPNEELSGLSLSAIAALPDGSYVAIGYPDPPEGTDATGFAFTSLDGLAWTAAPEPFPGAIVAPLGDLVEVPGGLVAFGGRDVWATRDGISWTEAGSLDAPAAAAAVMDDEIVVLMADYERATWEIQRGVIGH